MCLTTIPHTTSLSNDNCNNDRDIEQEEFDSKDDCERTRKTEQPSLKYNEKEEGYILCFIQYN